MANIPPRDRRSIRIKGYDYSTPGGYFVTVVTLWRDHLFGEIVDMEMRLNKTGEIVRQCWNEIPTHFKNAEIGEFVVMPNHIHGIIIIHESTVGATHASPLPTHTSPHQSHLHGPIPHSLGAIVGSFKSSVSRRANRELNLTSIWQRNYYEHILRDRSDLERIANYIASNPMNWDNDEENEKKPEVPQRHELEG